MSNSPDKLDRKNTEPVSLEARLAEPISNQPIKPTRRRFREELIEPLGVETTKRKPRRRKRSRLVKVLLELRDHSIATLALTTLSVSIHFILKHVLGDPTFFDKIPIRYAIDAGDIGVIITFFIIMIKKLWTMDKK